MVLPFMLLGMRGDVAGYSTVVFYLEFVVCSSRFQHLTPLRILFDSRLLHLSKTLQNLQ